MKARFTIIFLLILYRVSVVANRKRLTLCQLYAT